MSHHILSERLQAIWLLNPKEWIYSTRPGTRCKYIAEVNFVFEDWRIEKGIEELH